MAVWLGLCRTCGNPDDRFSHEAAQITTSQIKLTIDCFSFKKLYNLSSFYYKITRLCDLIKLFVSVLHGHDISKMRHIFVVNYFFFSFFICFVVAVCALVHKGETRYMLFYLDIFSKVSVLPIICPVWSMSILGSLDSLRLHALIRLAHAQADLSLCKVQMLHCWFSYGAAHLETVQGRDRILIHSHLHSILDENS